MRIRHENLLTKLVVRGNFRRFLTTLKKPAVCFRGFRFD
jgi:hypothetical protein